MGLNILLRSIWSALSTRCENCQVYSVFGSCAVHLVRYLGESWSSVGPLYVFHARLRESVARVRRASARHRVRPLVPRTNSKALGHSCLTSIEIVSRSIAPSCRSPRSTRLNPEISGQKNEIFTRGIRFRAFFSSIDRARREKNIHPMPPTPATDSPPNASPALPAPRRR